MDMQRMIDVMDQYARLGDCMQRQLRHLVDGSENSQNINTAAFQYLLPVLREIADMFEDDMNMTDEVEDVIERMDAIDADGFEDEDADFDYDDDDDGEW